MQQHLIRSRGAPTEVPEHYSQIYLDLETKYHWISVGTDRVEDWVGPLMDLEHVNQVLADFANGTGSNAGTVVHLPIKDESPYGRHFVIEVKNRDGRFNIVTDDATGTEVRRRMVRMIVDVKQGLELGTMFTMLNETDAEIELYETTDVYRFAGKADRPIRFYPGNMASFKLINVLGNTRYWLVWGDYDQNADTIDGRTLEDIMDEFGQTFTRRKEVEDWADDLTKVITAFNSNNTPV